MSSPSTIALVTGASGSLGWVLASRLAGRMDVIAAHHSHAVHPEGTRGIRMNLANPAQIGEVLAGYRPDVVFHLAAVTNADLCEREPGIARRVNADATEEIARWAGAARARLIFVSTDLVFDGRRGNYREDDPPAPLNVYGRTKLDAEKAVLDMCPGAVVIRGSLFYGIGGPVGKTFLSSLLETLSAGRRMRLFTDQRRNPVLLEDLAAAMIEAVDRNLTGLFHVAGNDVLTRYEFGQKVCEAFALDKSLLVPIKMEDFDYEATRPLDSSLNTDRFKEATGFEPTPLARALSDIELRW